MSQRPDRLRAGRESATGSALVDENRGIRIGRCDDAEGSSSLAGASRIVDPTQYQHEAY